MKILAISSNFPSKSKPYNGVFVYNLLLELASLGHEVSVISPQKVTDDLMPKETTEKGIRVFRPRYISFGNLRFLGIKTKVLSHLSFRLAVLNFVRRKKVRFDAIYSHFLFPSGATAVALSQRSGKPAFCSLGESTFESYEEVYSLKRIKRTLEEFQLVFPNSLDKKEFLTRSFGKDLKLRYVPNGVDTEVFFPASKAEARARLGLSPTAPIVLFVGGFIERKGPMRVLAACERLQEIPKMVFIGDGPQRPEHSRIEFCGKVKQEDLRLYLNAADVFVTPSRKEGMPNAFLEAMACSCRIVASDIPVHRKLVSEYSRGLLCDGEDIGSLSHAIERMLVSADFPEGGRFQYSLERRADTILKEMAKALE